MPRADAPDVYDRLMRDVWSRMVKVLGIHTVLVIVQRALWSTRQAYDEAALIVLGDDGVDFTELRSKSPDKALSIMEEFLASLTGIMTRLIGIEMSRKIAQEIDEWVKA